MIKPDPELLSWIRDFICERKRVTVEEIRREFFPGDTGRPYLYLDQLKTEGVIKWSRKTGLYLLARHPTPTPGSHQDCTHPRTSAARAQCRKQQRKAHA